MNNNDDNPRSNRKGCVLVVDDDKPTARSFKRLLATAGYQTEVAHDGETAIRKFEAIPFDVAILDYRLPDMNGMELLSQMKSLRSNFGCIVLTGNSNLQKTNSESNREFELLIKPVTLEQLIQAVEKCKS